MRRSTSSAGRPSASRCARQRCGHGVQQRGAALAHQREPDRRAVVRRGRGERDADRAAQRGEVDRLVGERAHATAAAARPRGGPARAPPRCRGGTGPRRAGGRGRGRWSRRRAGCRPRTTATGTPPSLPLTRSAARGELVGHRDLGDEQLVALRVDLAARSGAATRDARRADRDVGLPDPPGAAHRVGDDDGDVHAERPAQRGAQRGRRWRRGRRAAGRARRPRRWRRRRPRRPARCRACPRRSACGRGGRPPARSRRRRARGAAASRSSGSAGARHEPALDLGDHLGRDDHDVAVGQPGRGGGDRAGEVVAGAELGQARHRAARAMAPGAAWSHGGDRLRHRPTSRAARAIAAVAATSVISSGTARTSTPGTSAASPVCTSQPSSRPPSARAP